MRVSLFGVIWIALVLISFTKEFKYTIYLQIFSFVFQSAWVAVIGADLNASLITSVFLVFRYFAQFKSGRVIVPYWGKRGIAYTVYVLIISIIAPFVFAGVTIAHMTNAGYNFNLVEYYNLGFSVKNLTQPFAIILYVIDAIIIYSYCHRHPICFDDLKKMFNWIFYFVAIIGIVHVIFMYFRIPLGIIRELFHNEYQIIGATYFDYYKTKNVARLMSTFYEPSYCGVYIAGCLFSFLMEKKRKAGNIVLAAAVGLLNMSSSFFATMLIFAICCGLYRFLKYKRISGRNINLLMAALLAAVVLYFAFPSLRAMVINATVGKFASGSYDLRTRLNGYAWDAFLNTYGLGLGVNSVETTSLAVALIAQTGIIGTILYVFFISGLFKSIKKMEQEKRTFITAMISCSIIGGVVSCSALNFSVFWLSIMCFSAMRVSDDAAMREKICEYYK